MDALRRQIDQHNNDTDNGPISRRVRRAIKGRARMRDAKLLRRDAQDASVDAPVDHAYPVLYYGV